MVLQDPIVITGAARTPIGSFQGELKEATAPELGATAIRAALQRSRIAAEAIEEVVFGCVLPAGQGQAPARQAAIHAGGRPSVRDIFEGVYAEMPPHIRRQRQKAGY